MPAPDPDGVCEVCREDGRITVTGEQSWTNPRARNARMVRILRNVQRDGWRCRFCEDEVPLFRRADARYCSERCRKAAARARRQWRMTAVRDQRWWQP